MKATKCPRELSEERERKLPHPRATLSTNPVLAKREYAQNPDPFRTEFERDYTRIIHSRAFRRLRHKTQVFISPHNDHLCTRMEHSLHVASIGRTVSKALGLNDELLAAIAVGHDLGHAPFGHEGERCLNRLGKRYGITFAHELHSLRVVDQLESAYDDHRGLNLTFAVRDGIACHYGEGFEQQLRPNRAKRPRHLLNMERGDRPATLEACVVRWVDKVAYLGRDLEDALAEGIELVREDQIPRKVRDVLGIKDPGQVNRSVIATLVDEIVTNSRGDLIAVSPRVHEALNVFYNFNMTKIYHHPKVTRYFPQVRKAMTSMFREFLRLVRHAQKRKEGERLFEGRTETCVGVLADFLDKDVRDWRGEKAPQLVIDYIAGMTDNFFMASFGELFLPKSTL